MKKLSLLLATAFVGLSASAQLYVTGGDVVGAPAAWNPANPLEVTLENGTYTFQAKGGFKISTTKGSNEKDWNTFNSNARVLDGTWVKSGSTATASLKNGDTDISTPKSGSEITYVVDENLTTITGTLPNGETFGEAVVPDFYVIGSAFGSWDLKNESLKMSRSGNVYTYVAENGINGAWKINDGTWDVSFGQGESGMPVVGTVYNVAFNGGDMTSSITEKVTITFTYVEDGQSTVLLTAEGGDDPNPPTPPATDYTKWYLNVVGDFNDWKDNGVAFSAEGTAEIKDLAIGTSGFQIKIYNGSADVYYTYDETITVGRAYVLKQIAYTDMTIAGATKNSVYNVSFDAKTNTMVVTLVSGDDPNPPVVVPEKLYIIGNIPAGSWNPTVGVEMTKEGNVFTGRTAITDADNGYGYFSFCQVLANEGETGDPAWATVSSLDRFGAETEGEEVAISSTGYDFATYKANVNATDCKSFKIEASENGKVYVFKMDFNNKKLIIDQESGVESIEVEAGEAVYFNLQGQRVENPANGLFVRVLNGKATKVMVK